MGVKEKEVASVDELLALIDYGNTVRSTGSTGANADSSRSHAVIQLRLTKAPTGMPLTESCLLSISGAAWLTGYFCRLARSGRSKKRTEVGKFSFIDLAGVCTIICHFVRHCLRF